VTDNTLSNVTTDVVPSSWNQYFTALVNDFVGRNGAGEPEKGKKNGTATIPWGEIHADKLFLGGSLLDPENLGSSGGGNGIVSGATRSGSEMPDFLRANGAATSFNVLGATTPLNLNINSVGVSVPTDLTHGSLNTAPITNNTALIDDGAISSDKYAGENGSTIAIDNAGSEITDRVGEYVALKHGASEIMFARVASVSGTTAILDNVFRGFFFDSSGDPILREGLSNNDTLTLYNLAWIFLQSDGTTLDVSYTTPIWSYNEPSAPVIDDYWYDTSNQKWMRYDGSIFEEINRTHIGWVVMDDTNCIASRCLDFTKNFNEHISIETRDVTDTTVRSKGHNDSVSVYGSLISFGNSPAYWDITTDLEVGLVESASQFLYLYITQNGETVLSETHPYNRVGDLNGWYHPYHTWRYVGVAYNDSGSNFSIANSHNTNTVRSDSFLSSAEFLAIPNKSIKVIVTAGGGGGASSGGHGTSGSSSTFASFCSSTGGTRGLNSGTNGAGGSGSGGDMNISGGDAAGDGNGGDSYYGGVSDAGQHGKYYGGGGGGQTTAQGGGGGGGTAIKKLNNIIGRHSITVGAGGAGGTGGGKVGRAGVIEVEYL